MLAPVQMPPPTAITARKSLSLRDRMNQRNSSHAHAPSCCPEAQHAGRCQAGPQTACSPSAPEQGQPLPAVQLLASPSTAPTHNVEAPDQEKQTADEQDRRVNGLVESADCMSERSEKCARSGAVSLQNKPNSGEDSDTDLTQEDLPIAHEATCFKQEDSVSNAQDVQQQLGSLQDDSMQQAQPGPHSSGRLRQLPEAQQQQPQQLARPQQSSGDDHVSDGNNHDDDDQACWEEALEAGMLSPTEEADRHLKRPCTESEVIQLEAESADDLLDVLADAAASTPAAGHADW